MNIDDSGIDEEDDATYQLTAKGVVTCFLAFSEEGPKLPFEDACEYSDALMLDLFRRGFVIYDI